MPLGFTPCGVAHSPAWPAATGDLFVGLPGRGKPLAAGCDDFDTKPVEFDRLLEKIEQTLAAKGVGPVLRT
jgi:CheY-like chemotaxis protein